MSADQQLPSCVPWQAPSCLPWPRRTIVVLVIILVFTVTLVGLGVSPLLAIGAVIAETVVAITGKAPASIPGL